MFNSKSQEIFHYRHSWGTISVIPLSFHSFIFGEFHFIFNKFHQIFPQVPGNNSIARWHASSQIVTLQVPKLLVPVSKLLIPRQYFRGIKRKWLDLSKDMQSVRTHAMSISKRYFLAAVKQERHPPWFSIRIVFGYRVACVRPNLDDTGIQSELEQLGHHDWTGSI